MKILKYLFLSFNLIIINHLNAKMVEYIENIYLNQAPEDITKFVNEVAQQQNFDENYEVASPKKAGLQINPWNRMVASVRNPATGNIAFVINPDWFSKFNKDEKTYMISRAYITAKSGNTSLQ